MTTPKKLLYTKQAVCDYVIRAFIDAPVTNLFISDIAKHFNTNAASVRSALDVDLNAFDYHKSDRWSGSSWAGKYIQSWCVTPSKITLSIQLKVALLYPRS